MAGLKEQVKILKEEKAKAESSSSMYCSRYKDLESESKNREKSEKELCQRVIDLEAELEDEKSTTQKKVMNAKRKVNLKGMEEHTIFFRELLKMCWHDFWSWQGYFEAWVQYFKDLHKAECAN